MSEEEKNVSQVAEEQSIDVEDNTYLLKERFEIDYTKPLEEFDTNGAKAYAVKDKINPQRELFALICDNNFPPRLSLLPYLKSIEHPNLLKLVEYGVVDYYPAKTMNMALVYSRPIGGKVVKNIPTEKLTTEQFKSLATSMVAGCEALKVYNISHRAIRMDNLFFKDSDCNEIVLGDCAASFPGLYQPDVYETIESLLCMPQGRGNGNSSNDMYAVGVVLLGLVLQKEITTELSTSELLHQKLKKSSLLTLLNGEKISGQYSPVVKGLLEDVVDVRWKTLNVFNYLDGKSNTFSNSDGLEKSMRALTIGGDKHYTSKAVALAMLDNQDESVALLKNGKLLEWIKNGLENEKLYSKIDKILQNNKESDSLKFLIPQICVFLDYTLPIKCGESFVFPDGMSKAIYYCNKSHLSLDGFQQMLSSDLVKIWYQEQPFRHAPSSNSDFKASLGRNSYGYGIDRIMYDFDEDLPCTSELVAKEFVNTPSKLLKALDNNYSLFKEKQPFDKNIIAYLRCKMGKKIDGIITDINANQDAMRISAVIRLYASIQNKSGPVQLFNLTRWLMKSSKPIVDNYHNLKYRKFLERELVKTSKNGKIIELYELLENDEAKQKDRTDYAEVLKKINILITERSRVLSGDSKLDDEAKELALKFGSILSILTMLASFIGSIIYWVMK